jgi:ATP-dependent helicase/nuclease subunit A
VEYGRPVDDHGEPRELEELFALVRTIQESELWARATRSERMLAEVPFAVPQGWASVPRVAADDVGGAPPKRPQLDLFGGAAPAASSTEPSTPEGEGPPVVLEGVIDLAFLERGGWVIADYKTDVGTDPGFVGRSAAYRRQVDLYAEAWSELTGEPVKERVLVFTSQGREVRW